MARYYPDLPDCQTPNPNSNLGKAIAKTRQDIEDAFVNVRRIHARLRKQTP